VDFFRSSSVAACESARMFEEIVPITRTHMGDLQTRSINFLGGFLPMRMDVHAGTFAYRWLTDGEH